MTKIESLCVTFLSLLHFTLHRNENCIYEDIIFSDSSLLDKRCISYNLTLIILVI